MPMYEYRCSDCGYAAERYAAGATGSEKPEKCPKCGKPGFRKVFSTFASSCCGTGGSLPASGGCGGGSSHFS